jgi:hypothetical protein
LVGCLVLPHEQSAFAGRVPELLQSHHPLVLEWVVLRGARVLLFAYLEAAFSRKPPRLR